MIAWFPSSWHLFIELAVYWKTISQHHHPTLPFTSSSYTYAYFPCLPLTFLDHRRCLLNFKFLHAVVHTFRSCLFHLAFHYLGAQLDKTYQRQASRWIIEDAFTVKSFPSLRDSCPALALKLLPLEMCLILWTYYLFNFGFLGHRWALNQPRSFTQGLLVSSNLLSLVFHLKLPRMLAGSVEKLQILRRAIKSMLVLWEYER